MGEEAVPARGEAVVFWFGGGRQHRSDCSGSQTGKTTGCERSYEDDQHGWIQHAENIPTEQIAHNS
jgi:hypothetical protein